MSGARSIFNRWILSVGLFAVALAAAPPPLEGRSDYAPFAASGAIPV